MANSFSYYQSQVYQAAMDVLGRSGRAAIVQPAGVSRAPILHSLAAAYPAEGLLWLSPDGPQPGQLPAGQVWGCSYKELAALGPEQWVALARRAPALLVLEDFHYQGSGSWAEALDALLALCPKIRVLGLTSVPAAQWKEWSCRADILFPAHAVAELTLPQALAEGLLPAPVYTVALAPEQPMLPRLRGNTKSLRVAGGPEPLRAGVDGLRALLDRGPTFGQASAAALTFKQGRYLAICQDEAQRHMVMPRIKEWLALSNPRVEPYRAGAADMPAPGETSRAMRVVFCTLEQVDLAGGEYDGAMIFRRGQDAALYRRLLNSALAACAGPSTTLLDVVDDLEAVEDVLALKSSIGTASRRLRAAGQAPALDKLALTEPLREARQAYTRLRAEMDKYWDDAFEQARAYRFAHGTVELPRKVIVGDGLDLTVWLTAQRQVHAGRRPGYLTASQIERLTELGIHWLGNGERAWEQGCEAAQHYLDQHGDLLVPVRWQTEKGLSLGEWIVYNRQRRQTGALTPERVDRLQGLGMVWDTAEAQWQRGYHAAVHYYLEHGDLEAPVKYLTPDGFALGSWLGSQRAACKAGRLSERQTAQLEALGVDWSDRNERKWQASYEAAVRYHEAHGDLNVPSDYQDETGILLGKWISRQRYAYQNPERSSARLTDERRRQLDALGMQWGRTDPWQEHYEQAMAYRREHGVLDMPTAYKTEDGVWLGTWVCRQRAALRKQKPMSAERRAQLEQLFAGEAEKKPAKPRPSVPRRDHNWQNNYRRAKIYYTANGHLLVPASYVDETGCRLGVWVSNLRAARKKRPDSFQVTPEHIRLLDEIGMEWDARTAKWESACARAAEYRAAHGDLQVPVNYKTPDGFCLGDWVRRMREARRVQDPKLTQHRIDQLTALGIQWELD